MNKSFSEIRLAAGIVFLLSATLVANAQALNTWTNVTPSSLSITSFGTQTVGVDPNRPSDIYANFNQRGIYKSTDYGATWAGPINTGTGGDNVTNGGNFSIASGGAGHPPILYSGFGSPGFWKSTDGGVSWVTYTVVSQGNVPYPPDVDPYDPNHLIAGAHEDNFVFESTNGGQAWRSVNMNQGMFTSGGTAFVYFINTGSAATTGKTFLWVGQANSGASGTWRTSDAGASWTKVDKNEHGHGCNQLYQPGNGVVYMGGVFSDLGWGVLRSTNYGQTWTHVGANESSNCVFGTPSHVYSLDGGACVPCTMTPKFQVAPQPGTSNWTAPATPDGMLGGGVAQATVAYDGTHYILIAAMWDKGLWRYVEDSPTGTMHSGKSTAIASCRGLRNSITLTKANVVIRSTIGNLDIRGRAIRAHE